MIIERCVIKYLNVFKKCWIAILNTLLLLILGYYNLLRYITKRLTSYPFCKWACLCVFISLSNVSFWIYMLTLHLNKCNYVCGLNNIYYNHLQLV
jgi:hypothetical protein